MEPLSPAFTQATASATASHKTVVIIDENVSFTSTIRAVLQEKGFTVYTAKTPAEACYAIGFKPQMILCDMHLAVRKGIVPLKQMRFRSVQHTIEIVLMSLHATLYDIRYALKIGADDCLAKSSAPEIIALAIEARLQQKQHEQFSTPIE